MKMKQFVMIVSAGRARVLAGALSFVFALAALAAAQSTEQAFPTAITTNEITGSIQARDIGDARATTYYYTFNGTQGDVFVNVVTNNLNGDIDLFAADGLRSLTKIVVYADSADKETGRVIYLRKPEKLLLRVQGRTPNDDPATFRIKFAGSFVAAEETGEKRPELPEVRAQNESGVTVNSVGTIIAVAPKPTPVPPVAKVEEDDDADRAEAEKPKAEPADAPAVSEDAKKEVPEKRTEVVVTDNLPPAEKPAVAPPLDRRRRTPAEAAAERRRRAADAERERKEAAAARAAEEKAADPMANVRLVVSFKDGGKVEKMMPEVLRFSVDRGVLTIVYRDGKIERYQMVNVAKVTIE